MKKFLLLFVLFVSCKDIEIDRWSETPIGKVKTFDLASDAQVAKVVLQDNTEYTVYSRVSSLVNRFCYLHTGATVVKIIHISNKDTLTCYSIKQE